MSSRRWWALLASLAITAPAAPGAAQQPSNGAQPSDAAQLDAARALANAGLELFRSGHYEEALERFRSAERIHHAPPHVLYIARSLAALGRLVEARDAYRALADERIAPDAPPVFSRARQDARVEIEKVQPRLAHLTVEIEGEGASLALDGEPVALAPGGTLDVDPGEHRLVATKVGADDRVQVFRVGEGETATVRFVLPEVRLVDSDGGPPPPDGPSLVGPIVLMGVGGAGLILGGVMGGLALGKRNALDDACPDPAACPAANRALEDDGRTFGHVSTAGFVIGGVAAAAGITWLLLSMPDEEASAVRLELAPTRLTVAGRF